PDRSCALSRHSIRSVGGLRLSGQYPFGPSDHLAWAFCFVPDSNAIHRPRATQRMRQMHRGILIAALMLFAGSAMAADTGTRVDVDNGFTAQRDNILKELGDGETYSEI